MHVRPTAIPQEEVAQRWRDLAQRRRSHFIELYETGRWRHYYSEADFILRMREVCQAADQWEKLASPRRPAGQDD